MLLRAAVPVDGIDVMRARPAARAPRPRPLRRARPPDPGVGHRRRVDGADLVRGPVRILDDGAAPPRGPGSTRVGLSAGRGDEHPWRYFVTGDVNVSRASPAGVTGRW